MAVYNIYLGDPYGLEYDWAGLQTEVVKLFRPAIKGSKRYKELTAQRTLVEPNLAAGELLVYVVQSELRSVLRSITDPSNVDGGGLTKGFKSGEMGAEVYAVHTSPPLLAKLVFHEALHNKLKLSNEALHGKQKSGLAAAGVGEGSEPNTRDYTLMRKALESSVPQWLGGFAKVRGRK